MKEINKEPGELNTRRLEIAANLASVVWRNPKKDIPAVDDKSDKKAGSEEPKTSNQ